MNRRMESVKLMAALQPLTQVGCLKASDAKNMVEDYKDGRTDALKVLCFDPSMPTYLTPILEKVKQYI